MPKNTYHYLQRYQSSYELSWRFVSFKTFDYALIWFKGNASKTRDPYSDEQYSLLKPLDSSLPPEMVYGIFVFLDASPLTLFIGSPAVGAEWQYFFDDVFASTVKHLTAEDERIRYMANNVARKVMSDGSVPFWHRSHAGSSRLFINNFWKSTYVFGHGVQDRCTNCF